jgi:hypothetical protein
MYQVQNYMVLGTKLHGLGFKTKNLMVLGSFSCIAHQTLYISDSQPVGRDPQMGRGALEGGSRLLSQKVQQTGENLLLLNISKKNTIFSA